MKKKVDNAPEKRKKSHQEDFFFFVPDQGEGAAKVVVIVLKVLMLIVTTICCLVFGILGPVSMWANDTLVGNPGSVMWLVSSCVYIIGTFVIMLGHSRIASIIDIIGTIGSLVTYYLFVSYAADPESATNAVVLYMPCISLTIMAIIIALLINLPKWLDKQAAKSKEIAPSILADDDEKD